MRVPRLSECASGVACLLCALGLAALWRETNRERRAAAAASRMQERTAALERQVIAAEEQRKRLDNGSANLRFQLTFLPTANPTEETRREARRNLAKTTLDYGGLIHGLHLSAEVERRVEAVLADRRQRESDVRGAAALQGIPVGDPVMVDLLRQEQQRIKVEITQLIGAEDESQVEQYDRAAPIRAVLTTTADLAYEVPLSPEQNQLLTAALEQASPSYTRGGPADDLGATDAEPLLDKAKAFLSTDQLNAVRLAYARAQADFAIRRRVTELQAQGLLPRAFYQE